MGVIATHRGLLRAGVLVTDSSSIRRLKLRFLLRRALLLAVLLAGPIALREGPITPMRSVANPRIGVRLSYPARWKVAEVEWFGCTAAERLQGRLAPTAPLHSKASGVQVRCIVMPLAAWRVLAPEPDDDPQEAPSAIQILAKLAALLRFRGAPEQVSLCATEMAGGAALRITGPRVCGSWGSIAVQMRGDRLLFLYAAAPDREAFLRFEPTWRRMIRRLRWVSAPGAESAFRPFSLAPDREERLTPALDD